MSDLQRKTVTVLFCDVTGSTALGESTDPEALRALLARYFERMKAIVESHGGTVEKFIGDAVMAVFGVPQVHEDDALRACRAAIEMRDALPELGVEARIGVEHRRGRDGHGGAPRNRRRRQRGRPPRAGGTTGRDPDRSRDTRARPRGRRRRGGRAARAEREGKRCGGLPARGRPRHSRTAARSPVRRQGTRAGGPATGLGGSASGRARPARHDRRRPRGRQVAAGCRVPGRRRCEGGTRPMSFLRRGDHLLAGGRSAEAARRPSVRSRSRGAASFAAR